MSKFQWKKIEEHNDMRIYIINGLKNHQNPDEISGRMKKKNSRSTQARHLSMNGSDHTEDNTIAGICIHRDTR